MHDDATLAELGRSNYMEFCRESARWSGADGAIAEDGRVLLYATATRFPVICNGAWRASPSVPADELLDRADAFFADRGCGYTVQVSDLDGVDADVAAAAEARGLLAITDSPEMVCRAPVEPRPAPHGIQLRWVVDEEGVRDFVSVGATAYATLGMPEEAFAEALTDPARFLVPQVQSVVAYRDGEPVAAAQTVLSHGIAGVYWVGTVPAARGLGLADAVTRAVTNRAFELGATANTLQATEGGEPIYRRMGYVDLHRYVGWVRFDPPT